MVDRLQTFILYATRMRHVPKKDTLMKICLPTGFSCLMMANLVLLIRTQASHISLPSRTCSIHRGIILYPTSNHTSLLLQSFDPTLSDFLNAAFKPDMIYACKEARMKELHTTNWMNFSTKATRRMLTEI